MKKLGRICFLAIINCDSEVRIAMPFQRTLELHIQQCSKKGLPVDSNQYGEQNIGRVIEALEVRGPWNQVQVTCTRCYPI